MQGLDCAAHGAVSGWGGVGFVVGGHGLEQHGLVVEHFFEVWDSPGAFCGVAVEAAANLIEGATLQQVVEGDC